MSNVNAKGLSEGFKNGSETALGAVPYRVGASRYPAYQNICWSMPLQVLHTELVSLNTKIKKDMTPRS